MKTNKTTYTNLIMLILIAIAFVMAACAGPRGPRGADGQSITGPKGDKGDQGDQGPAGADGQIATVVQLCPGTTAYPGVFVEVALCINNELYGVYSANGGFLTKLPPGSYHSNAIGSACNLTVLPNCQVVPL